MPIFIINNNKDLKNKIIFSETDTHHLKNVLRIKKNEEIYLTDNFGLIAKAKIDCPKTLTLSIIEKRKQKEPYPIILCLPLIEQKRLELAVEKLTELGTHQIQLITTNRCQHTKISDQKLKRLEKIALSAQKQSLRAWPVKIIPPLPLSKILAQKACFIAAIIDDNNKTNKQIKAITSKCYVIVGPEGGFCQKENELLIKSGAKPISLGNTILRTETAAIALFLETTRA